MDCSGHTSLPTGCAESSIVRTTSISLFHRRSPDHALVTRLHTFLAPRLRNDAQLLHHLQIVGDAPVIPNLAIHHSLHRHALDTKALARGRDTKKLAVVGTL